MFSKCNFSSGNWNEVVISGKSDALEALNEGTTSSGKYTAVESGNIWTLSSSITDFEYIRIIYWVYSSKTCFNSIIIPTQEITVFNNAKDLRWCLSGKYGTDHVGIYRRFYFVNTTSIYWYSARSENGSNNTCSNTSTALVPQAITGININ